MTRPFFLGHESSAAPVVPDLIEAARAISEGGAPTGTVSVRFGPRFIVNAAGTPLGALTKDRFVEVVDYNPHQDQVLCLGEHAPSHHAGLHALVYRAKKEIGAIVQVEAPVDHPALARLPAVENKRDTLEGALAVLEKLRVADALAVGGKEVLAVGRDADEARRTLERALRGE